MTASRDTSCYDRALGLLARRPHFCRELQAKLNQRQYPAEEVDAVLERLIAGGFVNDRATTQAFVEEKLRRGPVGRSRLAADLGRRGAPREIGGLVDIISSPIYTTGTGLVLYGMRHQDEGRFGKTSSDDRIFGGVFKRMKDWFQDIF